jgi:hypothetical protein
MQSQLIACNHLIMLGATVYNHLQPHYFNDKAYKKYNFYIDQFISYIFISLF